MPELPEVETIVRALRDGGRGGPSILKKQVSSVDVIWKNTLSEPSVEILKQTLPGLTIQNVVRRAKYIVIQLNTGFFLVHLRMSGDLRIDLPPLDDLLTHDRLVLGFTDGSRLVFNDTRKFGRAWFTSDSSTILGSLGLEPFDPALSGDAFFAGLQRRKKYIKSLLLDQSFIAGLGNIYTDESLHRAGIHPMRMSNCLSLKESERLLSAIRETLEEGIQRNGASIDWVYRGGEFQNSFRVYQRTGEICSKCGAIIKRIVVGQRGTHFCPNCQSEKVGS